MKEEIWSTVQLRIDDVTLAIDVDKNLQQRSDVLKNNGYIEITSGAIGEKTIFWDNIEYFIELDYEKFKEECGDDLKRLVYNKKEIFKTIKQLIKRAIKLELLTVD